MAPREDDQSRSNAPHLSIDVTCRPTSGRLTILVAPSRLEWLDELLVSALKEWSEREGFSIDSEPNAPIAMDMTGLPEETDTKEYMRSLAATITEVALVATTAQELYQVHVSFRQIRERSESD
jgi:hypothetical protein